MKKIVFLTLGILIFLIPCISFADTAKCTYDSNNSISTNLDECLKNNSQLVDGSKADINGGFKTKVNSWTESLALFL
jgi:isopentenyl phosphate kinase